MADRTERPSDEADLPRLSTEEAGRVRALALVALLLLLPGLWRLFPAAAGPVPMPSCTGGAHRDREGRITCGPAVEGDGSLLDGRELFLMGTPLDVNQASARELELIPGVGPRLAARIVADREARGPFVTTLELDRVPGIGPKLVAVITRYTRSSPSR